MFFYLEVVHIICLNHFDLIREYTEICNIIRGDSKDRHQITGRYLSDCGWGQLSRYSDSLRAGRSGDRIPVWARFSTPVQTVPRSHPASYTMSTESFPEVNRPGRGVDHTTPASAEVKERVELYLYSSSWT
jgi:hypothetical protein